MEKADVFRLYCNVANVAVSNFDFTIEFGQRGSKAAPGPIDPEDLFGYITMSPQHFKAFAGALATSLRQYEDIFGTINNQPNEEAVKRVESEVAATNQR